MMLPNHDCKWVCECGEKVSDHTSNATTHVTCKKCGKEMRLELNMHRGPGSESSFKKY